MNDKNAATDNYILVPMQLDTLVLNPNASIDTPFLRFQMEYENLQSFETPEPTPFEGLASQPPAGIYLHWTMPKALRNGIQNNDGSTDFPLVPNRWLVVRMAPDHNLKAWVLESDYLGEDGTNPFIEPNKSQPNEPPTTTKIGKAYQLTPALSGIPNKSMPFLTALGSGNATFSIYQPGVNNVFSFQDDVTENDTPTTIQNATFTYYVTGWYSNPNSDPLQSTEWSVNTDPGYPGTCINNTFDWFVYSENPSSLPKQMIAHAMVSSVPWDKDGTTSTAAKYPPQIAKIPSTVKVAVGHTAVDALAALVRQNQNDKTGADILEAFQYGLLGQFDQPGSKEILNNSIRQHWFGASPGGTLWSIVPAGQQDSTALSSPSAPELTDKQKSALSDLNVQQREFDRQQRILQSMQWNLFSLWWKYNWQNENPLDDHTLWTFLSDQLPLQVGISPSCKKSVGTDPSQEDWYVLKVVAQKNLVAQLASNLTNAKTNLQGLLQDCQLVLKAANMPQYYYPNDPVVLITGLGRSTNFDPEDGILCRLPSQTVSSLTVDNTTYCTVTPGGINIQDKIPVLSDPDNLLPDCIQQLHIENFFLSTDWFAGVILGDATKSKDVINAIESLDPAADSVFAPTSYAWESWEQPWVPILLDWQVTVFSQPAYIPDGQTYDFNQDNWTLKNNDYHWNGPTTATGNNFSESGNKMQLKGRTFITPHASFNLVDQLNQYAQTHPELSSLMGEVKELTGKDKDILSQRLSGMLAMMVERNYTMNVAPFGDIAGFGDINGLLGNSLHGYPMPYPDQVSEGKATFDFTPVCGTFFVINKLMVIDSFGRTVDLTLSNYSTYPLNHISEEENYFYPFAGRDMMIHGIPQVPKPEIGESSDPTQRMLKLAPRIIQDSMLNFRLTSNDGQNTDIYQADDGNPVCAWVVPNHLDRSLVFYAPDGSAWGEIYLSLQAGTTYELVWSPDPVNPQAPQTIMDIPNTYIQQMLQALCKLPDAADAFNGLIQTIDEALWTIIPGGQSGDLNLSVLVGRPLAIVRAKLTLQLRGLPFYNQDWQNTFSGGIPSDSTTPVPIGAVDGGIFNYKWPVRLGSQVLRSDGLIGYYMDNPGAPSNNFSVFNTVNLPADVQNSYLAQIGGENNNYLNLRFIDDTVTNPDPQSFQSCSITMLVDPRCSINAFTGLLPVVNLGIPTQFTKKAFQTMSYLFRSGPFLTSPDAVRIPQPAENQGTWSWFDNVLGTSTNISRADGKVQFATTPPLVKEGWMKFIPNPPLNNGLKDK